MAGMDETPTKLTFPARQVRALYTDRVVRVYQAYSDSIADVAIELGTFAPPFKMSRMTWIKPSFLWMMCRAGWGHKEANQKRTLAIDIQSEGFEWALGNSRVPALEQDNPWGESEDAPVVLQWDPERDIFCNNLPYRSIQIGLGGKALHRYVSEWIEKITDIYCARAQNTQMYHEP
jgi:hypothetical protein